MNQSIEETTIKILSLITGVKPEKFEKLISQEKKDREIKKTPHGEIFERLVEASRTFGDLVARFRENQDYYMSSGRETDNFAMVVNKFREDLVSITSQEGPRLVDRASLADLIGNLLGAFIELVRRSRDRVDVTNRLMAMVIHAHSDLDQCLNYLEQLLPRPGAASSFRRFVSYEIALSGNIDWRTVGE